MYRGTLSTVVFTTGRTSAEHRYKIDCTALALMWTDDIELYGDMNMLMTNYLEIYYYHSSNCTAASHELTFPYI